MYGVWGMASEQVAFYMIPPQYSKEAFFDLIEDWTRLLVSDGYGIYQKWMNARQTSEASNSANSEYHRNARHTA